MTTLQTRYAKPFGEAICNVFRTMLDMAVELGEPVEITGQDGHGVVSAMIALRGDVVGTVRLSFPEDVALFCAEAFAGASMSHDIVDCQDAVGEIASIVAGSAKAQMGDKEIHITCPTSTCRAPEQIPSASGDVCFRIPCSLTCGQFCVDVCYVEVEGHSKPKAA